MSTRLLEANLAWRSVLGLLEEGFVLGDVALHLLGDLILGVDRLHRALGLASPTVYALFGVDQELVSAVVDAVNRTNLHTRLILCTDAGLGDYIGHTGSPSETPLLLSALYISLLELSRGR